MAQISPNGLVIHSACSTHALQIPHVSGTKSHTTRSDATIPVIPAASGARIKKSLGWVHGHAAQERQPAFEHAEDKPERFNSKGNAPDSRYQAMRQLLVQLAVARMMVEADRIGADAVVSAPEFENGDQSGNNDIGVVGIAVILEPSSLERDAVTEQEL